MRATGYKLLACALLCAPALVSSGTASAQLACIPGLPLPGCVAPPPSTGPTDPGGEPQPPPPPPPEPVDPCPVKTSAGRGSFAGVVAEQIYAGGPSYRKCALSQAGESGVRIIRQPLRWSEIERAKGVYDFSWWDSYVSALATHRIQVLPILFDPPSFRSSAPASGAKRGVYPPRSNSEMGAFAGRVARRYGTNGKLWTANPGLRKTPIRSWQVWNEPNLPAYWPTGPNAAQYTKLLRAVGKGLKKADPKAEVVTAGLPQSSIPKSIPQLEYINAMYGAGAADAFDTLAIHSYTEKHKQLVDQVSAVRAAMRSAHDRARIWITEIGWATQGPKSKFSVGPGGQAKRINQTFTLAAKERRSLGVRGIVYYMWQDAAPYPGFHDFWGLHTGLLDMDGNAKPGMASYKRHALKLKNVR